SHPPDDEHPVTESRKKKQTGAQQYIQNRQTVTVSVAQGIDHICAVSLYSVKSADDHILTVRCKMQLCRAGVQKAPGKDQIFSLRILKRFFQPELGPPPCSGVQNSSHGTFFFKIYFVCISIGKCHYQFCVISYISPPKLNTKASKLRNFTGKRFRKCGKLFRQDHFKSIFVFCHHGVFHRPAQTVPKLRFIYKRTDGRQQKDQNNSRIQQFSIGSFFHISPRSPPVPVPLSQ